MYSTMTTGDDTIDDDDGLCRNDGSLTEESVYRWSCRGTTVNEVARRKRGPFSKGIAAVAVSSLSFEKTSLLGTTITLLLLRPMMMESDATRFTMEGLDRGRGDCGRSESLSPTFLVLEDVSLGVRRKKLCSFLRKVASRFGFFLEGVAVVVAMILLLLFGNAGARSSS